MALSFKQVDVFTDRPFLGNPVAVVIDADLLESPHFRILSRLWCESVKVGRSARSSITSATSAMSGWSSSAWLRVTMI